MSSDPLPLPEIWSDPPEGDVETARKEFFANGRNGLVLVEYASGYAQQPDLQAFIRPAAHARQPAARERSPGLAPAALLKGLADLASTVTQAEALMRAPATLRSDVHFAVEHIHDVAMALRMRDVEAALCDTLDASVAEVGDALVRHQAAATGAESAAALLRDVLRRIEDLTVVTRRLVAAGTESPALSAAGEPTPDIAPSMPVGGSDRNDERGTAEEWPVASSSGPEVEPAAMPEAQAVAASPAGSAEFSTAEDVRLHSLGPIASEQNDTIGVDAVTTDAGAADTITTGIIAADASAEPVVAGGSLPQVEAIAAPDAQASTATEVTAAAEDRSVADVVVAAGDEHAVPARETHTTSVAKHRSPANDPLAVLYGLSEEELIALFS
jgi:hypothetical protein